MPTRINDVTLRFDKGEAPIPALAWWTAGYEDSGVEYTTRCPGATDPSKTKTAYNYWLRRGPFNLVDGKIERNMYLYAPKEEIDRALEPETNEWGDVCP